MTQSWDNLVSTLVGAQMALGGEKWGQTGHRAREDIHPQISSTVPHMMSGSQSVELMHTETKRNLACKSQKIFSTNDL